MPKQTPVDKPNPFAESHSAQSIARALATQGASAHGASLAERLAPARDLSDLLGDIAGPSSASQAVERALQAIVEPLDTTAITRAIVGHPPKSEIDGLLEKIVKGQDAVTDLLNGRADFRRDRIAGTRTALPHPATPALTAQTHTHASVAAPKGRKVASAADVGALVRAARRQLGITQQQFADLASVGRRFVSELESGKPSLEFDKVLKCCGAAGIDVFAQPRGTS